MFSYQKTAFLLFFFFAIFLIETGKASSEIKVLLFDDMELSQILVKGKFDSIQLNLDNNMSFKVDSTDWARISLTTYGYKVTHNNRTYFTKSINISNLNSSLIHMYTRKFQSRYYYGKIDFERAFKLKPVNTLSIEDYISSVVGSEMNFKNLEALKVQSVISRTFAYWNLIKPLHEKYDLTDHTLSQVYLGEIIDKPWYRIATKSTENEIITYSDKVTLSVFSSTCGGHTSNNSDVWSGKQLPYLKAISDQNACENSPHFRWSFLIKKNELSKIIKNNWNINFSAIELEKTVSGRVKIVRIKSNKDRFKEISGNEFRLAIIKSKGPKSLKSTFFDISLKSDEGFIFEGKGLGHGVGLCQWGALGLAENGWNYRDIIYFYYGGTRLKNVYYYLENQTLKRAD